MLIKLDNIFIFYNVSFKYSYFYDQLYVNLRRLKNMQDHSKPISKSSQCMMP